MTIKRVAIEKKQEFILYDKYDYISELAENTAFEIVQNQEEWKKYLTTAARL